jgi:hypothetical protein
MKKNIFVIFMLIFLLAGCTAKEEHAAVNIDSMMEQPGQEESKTASAVTEVEAKDQEEPENIPMPEPKDIDYSTSKLSATGAYTISYRTIGGDIRINKVHSWEITILDADGQPVNDARVVLTGSMPEQGHEMLPHPLITRAGFAGLYRVDNMKFDMTGWWVITINIMAGEVPDSVNFNLNIP